MINLQFPNSNSHIAMLLQLSLSQLIFSKYQADEIQFKLLDSIELHFAIS